MKWIQAHACHILMASPDSPLVSAFVAGAEFIEQRQNGIHEDELPEGYPYDEMFPYSWVDIVRMFPSMEFVRGYLAFASKATEVSNQNALYHKALRNCLAYAKREKRRITSFRAIGAQDWDAIIQFCEAAGVKSSILRSEEPA